MSDSWPEPDSLPPAQDDAVRKLLASARHTDPTPPDVVARLDTTLASLTSERREVSAPVVTLASRRRRTAATALLAAAAVVVLGIGITQVLPPTSTDGGDSAGSAAEVPATSDQDRSTAESGEALDDRSDSSAGADEKKSKAQMRTQEDEAATTLGALEDLSALISDAELRPRLRELRPAAPFSSSYSAGPECLVGAAAPGDHVSITYDGVPGVLVYREPAAGRQLVDVYVCGEPDPVRSLRLRAP